MFGLLFPPERPKFFMSHIQTAAAIPPRRLCVLMMSSHSRCTSMMRISHSSRIEEAVRNQFEMMWALRHQKIGRLDTRKYPHTIRRRDDPSEWCRRKTHSSDQGRFPIFNQSISSDLWRYFLFFRSFSASNHLSKHYHYIVPWGEVYEFWNFKHRTPRSTSVRIQTGVKRFPEQTSNKQSIKRQKQLKRQFV